MLSNKGRVHFVENYSNADGGGTDQTIEAIKKVIAALAAKKQWLQDALTRATGFYKAYDDITSKLNSGVYRTIDYAPTINKRGELVQFGYMVTMPSGEVVQTTGEQAIQIYTGRDAWKKEVDRLSSEIQQNEKDTAAAQANLIADIKAVEDLSNANATPEQRANAKALLDKAKADSELKMKEAEASISNKKIIVYVGLGLAGLALVGFLAKWLMSGNK